MPDNRSEVRPLGRRVVTGLTAFFRPWPIHPLMAAPIVLFFTMWTIGLAVLVEIAGGPTMEVWRIIVSIVIPLSILIGAYVIVWRVMGSQRSLPWWGYWAFLVSMSVLIASVRLWILTPSFPSDTEITTLGLFESISLAPAALRVLVSLLLINSIFGAFATRLQRQVQQTEAALTIAKEQQRRLVTADEAARRQVAADLHDRIQAALVLIGLQVQQIGRESSQETAAKLNSIADEIEYVRGDRLHEVIEGLAPDYDLVGLRAALDGLVDRYRPAMSVDVQADDQVLTEIEADPTWVEAVYRVCEQALLNSVVHGDAEHSWVRLEHDDGKTRLLIRDDGSGLAKAGSASSAHGLGTAVTDAWVGLTSGEWHRVAAPQGGVLVDVTWDR